MAKVRHLMLVPDSALKKILSYCCCVTGFIDICKNMKQQEEDRCNTPSSWQKWDIWYQRQSPSLISILCSGEGVVGAGEDISGQMGKIFHVQTLSLFSHPKLALIINQHWNSKHMIPLVWKYQIDIVPPLQEINSRLPDFVQSTGTGLRSKSRQRQHSRLTLISATKPSVSDNTTLLLPRAQEYKSWYRQVLDGAWMTPDSTPRKRLKQKCI